MNNNRLLLVAVSDFEDDIKQVIECDFSCLSDKYLLLNLVHRADNKYLLILSEEGKLSRSTSQSLICWFYNSGGGISFYFSKAHSALMVQASDDTITLPEGFHSSIDDFVAYLKELAEDRRKDDLFTEEVLIPTLMQQQMQRQRAT